MTAKLFILSLQYISVNQLNSVRRPLELQGDVFLLKQKHNPVGEHFQMWTNVLAPLQFIETILLSYDSVRNGSFVAAFL